MGILLDHHPSYILERVELVIVLDHLGTLKVADWLPRVVAFRVSLPLDEVLQLFSPPLTSVAANGLNFVLFFTSHKVWGRSRIVCAMFFHFYIWGEKGGMENGVDGPLRR
jgi:hypothetical protein